MKSRMKTPPMAWRASSVHQNPPAPIAGIARMAIKAHKARCGQVANLACTRAIFSIERQAVVLERRQNPLNDFGLPGTDTNKFDSAPCSVGPDNADFGDGD